MGRATINRFRDAAWHEAQQRARPPLLTTASRPLACLLCDRVIGPGEHALHKLRVGIACVPCGTRAWGQPESETGGAA